MALPDTADAPDTASEKPWEMFARKKPWELFAKAAPATPAPAATPALDQDIAAQKQLAEGTRQFHQTYEQYAEENPTETQRKLARLAPLADTPAKQYQLGRLAADRLVPELPVNGVVGDLVQGGSVGPFHTLRDIEVPPEHRQRIKELLATLPPDPPDLAPPPTKTQKFLTGAGESVGNTEDFLLSPVGVLTLFGSSASIIPKAVQRVISFAFAAQMASQLPETATALTQELQKPEKERDYEKIGNLVTTGASGTLFSAVAAAHGLRVQPEWQGPAPRGDVLPMPPGAQPPPINPQVPPPRSQAAPPPLDPAARPAPGPLAPSVPSVSSTPVEPPAPALPPERQKEIESLGHEMGFVFDGASSGSRTTGPLLTFTLSGLPKDDPAHGAGFTTKFTDSAAQIRAKAQAKIDAFRPGADPAAPSRAGDQPASTAGAPAPPAGQPTPKPNSYSVEFLHDGQWHYETGADTYEAARKEAIRRKGTISTWRVVPNWNRVTESDYSGKGIREKVLKPAVANAPSGFRAEDIAQHKADYTYQLNEAKKVLAQAVREKWRPEAIASWKERVEHLQQFSENPPLNTRRPPPPSGAPLDLSPQAAQDRLAWRKFNPIGPGEGGTRWGAIENTYISAKAAQEALPDVPLKDIFGITIKRGPYPQSPEVDHFFVERSRLNEFTSNPELNKKYPPGEFSQSVAPGYKPHSPRKGEPSYKEWLAGKRPATAEPPPAPAEDVNPVTPPAEPDLKPTSAEDEAVMLQAHQTGVMTPLAKALFRVNRARSAFLALGKWAQQSSGEKRQAWQRAKRELEESQAAVSRMRSQPAETPAAAPSVPSDSSAPSAPVEATPKASDRLQFLSVPETDPGEIKAKVQELQTTHDTLRAQQAQLQARIKELEKVVTYQTGPRYRRGTVKPSAPKKQLAEYKNAQAQWSQLGTAANAIAEQHRAISKPVEFQKLQQRVNNAKLPALTRLLARKELFNAQEGKMPAALGNIIRQETHRVILEHYPDATPEEVKKLEWPTERAASMGEIGDAWRLDPEMNLYAARRGEVKSALSEAKKDSASEEFSDSLNADIEQYAPYWKGEAPIQELPRTKADELISRIQKEAETIRAKHQAEAQAAEAAAKEMEQKFTTVIETDAVKSGKQAKDKLVGALETALEKAPEQAAGRATVSIKIPGDGTFKIVNVKEAIAHVLDEARKLDTSKGGRFQRIPVSSAKHSASNDAGRAVEVYGTRARAYQTLKQQVGMAKELELSPEQTERLGKVVEVLENTIREKWQKARDTLSRAEDREELLIKQFGAKSKQVAENRKNIEEFKRGEAKEKAEMEKELGETSTPKPTSKVSESRIDRPSAGTGDPFTMDEGDLADLLEEQYGEPGATGKAGEFGRQGQFTFPSYDAFAKWMDERYAERDHEGMRLAFAEADTANKIRYIKENRGANDHKKAWLTNLATGADLPKVDPPVARTTPRPMPGGRSQPPPPRGPGGGAAPPRPGPQARPAGPPPPPRKPSLHRKFDITALTQFFRLVGKHPTMNSRLKRAYGRFIEGPNVVQLKSRLLWDTKLAERVLGHEIGHFIDLAIPVLGKGKRFAERIRPLFDFKNQIGKKKELRNDARDLSRDWRGDFHNGDTYRDSAEELFADFLSAMFNKPEWVNQKYPRLYDAFQELRDAKPQFKSAYREIETWLQGDTVVRELADQDKAAIEKTVEIVTEKKEKSAATYADRINFAMMSLWQRAFQKEGKPRQIGSSVTESLEASYMWAAKRLALWHDDFLKTVQPLLNQVSHDPVQARAHLLSYSKAVRTIGERRAAGVWIEQNPQEARQLLTRVLRLDPTLYSKFADALGGAKDPELYDLAASIFREIHDRKAKYVQRIARQIDDMHLGVDGQAALMAFNVRGKLLNPGGLTPETSAKMLDHLRDALGPDKFDHLEKAAAGLRDLMFSVQKEMADSGLISKKIWNELIAPNQDNYLPYAVLDYFDGHVRAGVMPQKGTALDVADVVTSTQLKVSSAFLWLQRQRQVQLLRDAYARGGATLPLGEELERASDLKRHQNENGHDATSRAVIWADGKPHLMEFPGDPGKMLQEALALPEFYSHVEWMHTASKWSHQLMQYYTQFNPRFLLYRNIIRGFRTAGLKVGFGAAFQQMRPEQFKHNLALARNYADAAFGGEMLPEVRQLVNLEALPAPHLAAGSVVDLPNMRELIVQGALPAFSAKHLRGDLAEKRGVLSKTAQAAKNVTDKLFTTYEAFEKIYNYNAAIAKGLDPATAAAIAKRGGIPRPGVSGKWSGPAELFFPWTRVKLQGYRATYDMLRDPRFRKAFLARFMVSEALPRLAKVAIGAGLIAKTISWATGSPRKKDDDDGVMAEVFKRISPYKMALDDVVPTMLYDPRTGKYHYFWEYNKGSQIPKHFEVVSIRIPSSEEGQVWGTMLYNAMVSVPGINEKLSTPGQGPIENMGNWAINSLSPQLSPAITTGANLETMVFQGRNPQDSFKGQPAANQQLFDAGGAKRLEAITGYTLNSAGGPGELSGAIAANANILDPRALDSLKSRLSTDTRPWSEKIPFLGAAVSHDNYAQYRTDKLVEVEEKKLRANARLIMPDDVRSLYDFYYLNLARQKNLTASERVQFDASKHFVEKIWGNLSVKGEPNPDSFYAKAAHAVGPDGSAQAKATLTRDLQQAAAIDIATFKHARRTN